LITASPSWTRFELWRSARRRRFGRSSSRFKHSPRLDPTTEFRKHSTAAGCFRLVTNGDLLPKWTEVWTHIYLGKIFDISGQRERAVNEYTQAQRTCDNTQGAQDEVGKFLKTPYKEASRGAV